MPLEQSSIRNFCIITHPSFATAFARASAVKKASEGFVCNSVALKEEVVWP